MNPNFPPPHEEMLSLRPWKGHSPCPSWNPSTLIKGCSYNVHRWQNIYWCPGVLGTRFRAYCVPHLSLCHWANWRLTQDVGSSEFVALYHYNLASSVSLLCKAWITDNLVVIMIGRYEPQGYHVWLSIISFLLRGKTILRKSQELLAGTSAHVLRITQSCCENSPWDSGNPGHKECFCLISKMATCGGGDTVQGVLDLLSEVMGSWNKAVSY